MVIDSQTTVDVLVKLTELETDTDGPFTLAVMLEVDILSKEATGRYVVMKLSKEAGPASQRLETINETNRESLCTKRWGFESEISHVDDQLSLFSSMMQGHDESPPVDKSITKISMILDWISARDKTLENQGRIQQKLLNNFTRNFA